MSTLPSTSVCKSDVARVQYSVDVPVKNSFGTCPLARARSNVSPRSPVSESNSVVVVNGKNSDGERLSSCWLPCRVVWAKRWLKYPLPLFVDVEAFVNQVMDETPRLRNAERIGPFDRPRQRIGLPLGIFFGVPQKADGIADGGKPQAGDARSRCRVDELIK